MDKQQNIPDLTKSGAGFPASDTVDTPSVLAVVVTYNPDVLALEETIAALNNQHCHVVVIDNASLNQAVLNSSTLDATVILNQDNLGLGKAHNQGVQLAQDQGAEYVLIMDQDSVPSPDMVSQLVSAYREKSEHYQVSAVGSCYLNSDNQSESFFVKFGMLKFRRETATNNIVNADFLISSGSLFSVSVLQQLGGMDESLFIDHVDTEWFLRARSQGYKAFGVGAARMQHGLGEKTHRIRLGQRQRNVPQHKPFRYYYIFRNSIALYKRGYTSWLWKWNDIQRLVMILVMFGLMKAPRQQNLKMMVLGVWHGLLGKMGKLQQPDN